MDVADEMDQKGEVTGCSPFVIVSMAKALRILIDLVTQFRCGHRAAKSVPCPEGRCR